MIVTEPEGNFSAGVSHKLTPCFQLVSGRKGESPHFPGIQHNESYDNPYEKMDAVQAEEFATINVHDCSLPWVYVLIIPDRELPADSHIVFDPPLSGIKIPVSQPLDNPALPGSTSYSGASWSPQSPSLHHSPVSAVEKQHKIPQEPFSLCHRTDKDRLFRDKQIFQVVNILFWREKYVNGHSGENNEYPDHLIKQRCRIQQVKADHNPDPWQYFLAD